MSDDKHQGMTPEPDMSDPAQVYAHRVIETLKREFADDDQVPRFVVLVETPPEGRIGIASTGDNEIDVHRMLTLGAASVRNAMTPEEKAAARFYWDQMRAGLENQN